LFTIRRGLPNTIDTREESRHSSRSQGFSTQHKKCPLRWLSIGVGLGMGEGGEEPRDDLDGSSTHSFAPLCSSPSSHRRFARVERPSAKERVKRGKSREGLRHIAFAPLCSSPSSHRRFARVKRGKSREGLRHIAFAPLCSSPSSHRRFARVERPGARAKSQSQEAEPRAFVPLRRGANRVALFFTHTHIHSLTYTLMHTHWCIRILRRTSDVEFSVLVLLLMIVLIIHSIVHTSRWPRVVYTLLS
jgi:hypothetical protein